MFNHRALLQINAEIARDFFDQWKKKEKKKEPLIQFGAI